MTLDATAWPTSEEAAFAEALRATMQRDMEDGFPGRGTNLFIHTILSTAGSLFNQLVEEDFLADILNAHLELHALRWRLVPVT